MKIIQVAVIDGNGGFPPTTMVLADTGQLFSSCSYLNDKMEWSELPLPEGCNKAPTT